MGQGFFLSFSSEESGIITGGLRLTLNHAGCYHCILRQVPLERMFSDFHLLLSRNMRRSPRCAVTWTWVWISAPFPSKCPDMSELTSLCRRFFLFMSMYANFFLSSSQTSCFLRFHNVVYWKSPGQSLIPSRYTLLLDEYMFVGSE